MKVMFVCMGNICRSPLAHAVFDDLARSGATPVAVDSTGTDSYHEGEPADARMRAAAAERGTTIDHRSRPLTRRDLQTFDLVIAMDDHNLSGIRRIAGGDPALLAKVHLLREFEPDGPSTAGVPDPYYGGARGFADVYDIVARCCTVLYDRICRGDLAPR